MHNRLPFGGKLLLLSEDFWQILPVVPYVSGAQIVIACFKTSFFDHSFQSLWLMDKLRLQSLLQDPAASEEAIPFLEFPVKVAEGKVPADDINYIGVSSYIYQVHSYEDRCEYFHKQIEEKHGHKKWPHTRATITAGNDSLESINQIVGMKFLGEILALSSADQLATDETCEGRPQYLIETLSTLTVSHSLATCSLWRSGSF